LFAYCSPEFHYPDTRTRKAVTDGVGNNVSVYENGSQVISFSYSSKGGLKSITSIGKTINFGYDVYGRLKTKTTGQMKQTYVYDNASGNLLSRDYRPSGSPTGLTESFSYDNLNRLTGSQVTGAGLMSVTYSPDGNINTKTDAGSYTYDPSKQNAVTAITRYYSGSYEKTITGSTVTETHYVSSPTGLVAILVKQGSAVQTYYVETDHLGSVTGIINTDKTYASKSSYDAWGRRRNPSDWSYNNIPTPVITDRGFTGHEHLDRFGLINMNGRMYDPVVGRFLGVDPIVQAPDYSQSFNGYSYCWNNPLKYTDPSGYLAAVNTGDPDPWFAYQQFTKRYGYDLSYSDFSDQFWDQYYNYLFTGGDGVFGGYGGGNYSMTFTWHTLEDNPRSKVDYERLELTIYPSIKVEHSATMQMSFDNDLFNNLGGYSIQANNTAYGLGLTSGMYSEATRGLTTTTSTIAGEAQAAKVLGKIATAAKWTGYVGNALNIGANYVNVYNNPSAANYARLGVSGFAVGLNLVNFLVPGLGTGLSLVVSTVDMMGGFNWLYNSLEENKIP